MSGAPWRVRNLEAEIGAIFKLTGLSLFEKSWTVFGELPRDGSNALRHQYHGFPNLYPDAKFALQVSGNNLQLTLVPEPGTYAVLSALSLLLFAIYRHRRA